jgi:hypothetical protein
MLMTSSETDESLLTSHYTVRCLSLTGLVIKISIHDLLRKLKTAPTNETVQNMEFFMRHKADLAQQQM